MLVVTRTDQDADGRIRLLYVVLTRFCCTVEEPVAADTEISSKSQYVLPSCKNTRTIAAADVAAFFTTISAILVPVLAPVISVPTLVGAVYEESAVATETAPILGVTAKTGLVAIEFPYRKLAHRYRFVDGACSYRRLFQAVDPSPIFVLPVSVSTTISPALMTGLFPANCAAVPLLCWTVFMLRRCSR